MKIRVFKEPDRQHVIRLWRECGLTAPANDPGRDIDAKVSFQPDLFFVGEVSDRIVTVVMAGYEGHRGWINYLGVDPKERRRGCGKAMVEHCVKALSELGCPKINLVVRAGNETVVEFYNKLGFSVEERILMGRRL